MPHIHMMYPAVTSSKTSPEAPDNVPFVILSSPRTCPSANQLAVDAHSMAGSAPTTASKSLITFFSMPLEIRWQIYELLFTPSNELQSCSDPSCAEWSAYRDENAPRALTTLQALLMACKRMYNEEPIKQMFYTQHTFVFCEFARPRDPDEDPFDYMVTENNETHFLKRYSWTQTMPLMRNMIFQLGPPGTFGRRELTPRQERGFPIRMDPVDFQHRIGWLNTLQKTSVLGLHISDGTSPNIDMFEKWLSDTLWSLVGALPGIKSVKPAGGEERWESTPEFKEAIASGIMPAGPMIVVYVPHEGDFFTSGREAVALKVVESIIPRERFKFVSCFEAINTPFLDQKRIAPAWFSDGGATNAMDSGFIRKALADFLRNQRWFR